MDRMPDRMGGNMPVGLPPEEGMLVVGCDQLEMKEMKVLAVR
jgi:hypothetical protein